MQTSAGCIRTITTGPFAGVAVDEAMNPRPIAALGAMTGHCQGGVRQPLPAFRRVAQPAAETVR